MTHFVIILIVLGGAAVYLMKPDERGRLFRVILVAIGHIKNAATLDGLKPNPFSNALRVRTPRVLVTPAIVALSATIFILMTFAPGPIAGSDTLIRWGANFPPRTTSGEWWRLVTAMFIHARMLDLFVNAVCLIQLGVILERLVGPVAFTAVYIASGVTAGIVSLSAAPDAVSAGASPAIFGMYGLLFATSIGSLAQRSVVKIPLDITKKLAPVAAVFVAYNLIASGYQNAAELTALATGLVGGVVTAIHVRLRRPPMRRVSAALATMVTIAGVYAVAVHRPVVHEDPAVGREIERVIAIENHTAGIYDEAAARFRKGRITAAALAGVIEHTILPELRAAAVRITMLHSVLPEHRPLVATTEKFLRLRDESWQLRAAALHKGDMHGLREADVKEQASLEAFQKMKPPPKISGG
jgi:membrane associated rhomboid family serine protease